MSNPGARSHAKRRLSEAEHEKRRAQDRDRMNEAARQLLSSDGWQRWVKVRAANGLGRYSFGNQLLIALQTGGQATFVAGFRAWLQLGYCVNKGEKAIRILAPMAVKNAGADSDDEDAEQIRTVFRAVSVFDRRQVSPLPDVKPQPLEPPCEPLSGESHDHLLEPLRGFAARLGFSVDFEPIEGPQGGWCDRSARRIVVDADAPANGQVRVLVHELAHALGVGYREFGRERAEVIVDTVTFIVCSGVGLDVSGESVPYVAGWGEEGALEAVTEFAQTIDALARQLQDALADGEGQECCVSRNAEAVRAEALGLRLSSVREPRTPGEARRSLEAALWENTNRTRARPRIPLADRLAWPPQETAQQHRTTLEGEVNDQGQ